MSEKGQAWQSDTDNRSISWCMCAVNDWFTYEGYCLEQKQCFSKPKLVFHYTGKWSRIDYRTRESRSEEVFGGSRRGPSYEIHRNNC